MPKYANCSTAQQVTVSTGLTPDTIMSAEVISGDGTWAAGAADEVDLISPDSPGSTLYRLYCTELDAPREQYYWLHAYDADAEATALSLTAGAPASK